MGLLFAKFKSLIGKYLSMGFLTQMTQCRISDSHTNAIIANKATTQPSVVKKKKPWRGILYILLNHMVLKLNALRNSIHCLLFPPVCCQPLFKLVDSEKRKTMRNDWESRGKQVCEFILDCVFISIK